MVDTIVTDEKELRVISRDTTAEEVADLDLVNRLRAACDNAWTGGCGLAAIQIGVPLRFGWFVLGGVEYTMINPVIISQGKTIKVHKEGCLSIPDTWVVVPRAYKIKLREAGRGVCKLRGKMAHIVQHELDHMDGVLNIDNALEVKRKKETEDEDN